jgi:hypothetical protein
LGVVVEVQAPMLDRVLRHCVSLEAVKPVLVQVVVLLVKFVMLLGLLMKLVIVVVLAVTLVP